jgi:diguanylate cyclase (GGDEF)-like protein/PAS domain S-box-containing protein
MDVLVRATARITDQKIVFMNCKFTDLFGYELGDFDVIGEWIASAYPFQEDRTLASEKWGEYFASPGDYDPPIETLELRVRCKDKTIKTVLSSGIILPGPGLAVVTFVDITERIASERQAKENEIIYRVLLDHSPEMIVLSPFDLSRRYVSPAVHQITGFTSEEYLALGGFAAIHPDHQAAAAQLIKDLKNGNLVQTFRYRTLRKSGGCHWVEATVNGYLNPGSLEPGGYVATIRDIAEQKAREEELASENQFSSRAAATDVLTGISNRRFFNEALRREGIRQTRSQRDLSLMLLDIDFFKLFNDMYGHLAGDSCLTTIAQTLKKCLRRDTDLVARFGGEEFVILLPMTERTGAIRLAEKILQAVADLAIPHIASSHSIVTASIAWSAGLREKRWIRLSFFKARMRRSISEEKR